MLTNRFSVCVPTVPPAEVFSTNYLATAVESAGPGQVVYDWASGLVVHPVSPVTSRKDN